MHYTGTKSSSLDYVLVKTQILFNSHGGFLTDTMFHMEQSNQTHYDETRKGLIATESLIKRSVFSKQ